MTPARRLGLVATVLVGVCLGVTQQRQPAIRLTLRPAVLRVTSGGEIAVQIISTNVSQAPLLESNLDVDGKHAENTYGARSLTVVGPDGAGAPLTAFGRRMQHSVMAGSGGLMPKLLPGASATETLILSRLFDLTIPGVYTVWVSAGGAESNHIRIEVSG